MSAALSLWKLLLLPSYSASAPRKQVINVADKSEELFKRILPSLPSFFSRVRPTLQHTLLPRLRKQQLPHSRGNNSLMMSNSNLTAQYSPKKGIKKLKHNQNFSFRIWCNYRKIPFFVSDHVSISKFLFRRVLRGKIVVWRFAVSEGGGAAEYGQESGLGAGALEQVEKRWL